MTNTIKQSVLRALDKIQLLGLLNLELNTVINRKRFKIPLLKRSGLDNLKITEPWMIQLLEKILAGNERKTYIDVGVNLGQTLLKLRSVHPTIKYIGLEPNPACISYVRQLIAANGFEHTTLLPVGIAEKTGIYELAFVSEETDTASIVANFRPGQKVIRREHIACFKASELFNNMNELEIGIVKIDVEGSEKEVIEGFSDLIVQQRPLIQIEILPVYEAGNESRLGRQQALEQMFRDWNYALLRIHTNADRNLAGLEEVASIGVHSNIDWCEYLVVPREKKESVMQLF